jgi:(E)-4-hydroxy-3-methylbut-2-enyl-diphosphate synthase
MLTTREKTRQVKVGKVLIGGGAPVTVQSMTKTKTADIDATVAQIEALTKAGCQIIRSAVPDKEAALALKEIKSQISIPLVADIHFNHEYALIAAQGGVDKLRINPGNIGDKEKIAAVVKAAKDRGIPIRIGVNSGSLEKSLKKSHQGHVTVDGLVESALNNIRLLEELDFYDIVVSVKATSIPMTVGAYRQLADKVPYPLHVGMTEAGIPKTGIIRSAAGIGAVLSAGLGDTIRVSLTGDPVEEVRVGLEILKGLELLKRGVTIISCPTCGRADIDVEKIASQIEERTRTITTPLTVAVMGCEVNGPGEAAEADLGLAGGKGVGLIFRAGQVVKKVPESEMVTALLEEIEKLVSGR